MNTNKSQELDKNAVFNEDTTRVSSMEMEAPKSKINNATHSLISQYSSIIGRQTIENASVEHTLAMIKPEGMGNERKILARFKKEGFMILAKRRVHLTPEQVSDFYHDLYGYRGFPLLVASTSSAPVGVYCLGRPNAVEKLKEVVGPCDVGFAQKESPECLNAQFGNADCNFPAVHASCDPVSARREIQFFFPQGTTEREKRVMEGIEFFAKEVQPLLKEGLAQMLKEKPAEPMLWLAGWLLTNNPNKPFVPEHLQHQHFYPSKQFDN